MTTIVDAAIALADAEGVEAVSMRRIASELGVGTMSLYRYVETKDDLLDLMIDQVMGERVVVAGGTDAGPAPAGDWRARLRAIAVGYRAMLLRHPWVLAITASRPPLGPNMLDNTERMLGAMDGLGLGIDAMAGFGWTVMAFVRGFVMSEIAEVETIRRTGQTEDDYRRSAGPYLVRVLAEGKHPLLARFVHDADDDRDVEEGFGHGLEVVLDGLAVELGRLSVAGDSVSGTN
ncbi:TetR/AcrR family transcriptional regulator [Streptacidiphilus fuscans]|uniref:TetR/AcrR family transcriptional regulator n=1 Tax=Streptacidiphilus fuscans TaxID=2789292 RepID=UPI002E28EB49|nr:TetR/AcrR family transcriptional regulator [Streptacidiphilus fuscans]